MNHQWEFVLLRQSPDADGRVTYDAFIATYQVSGPFESALRYLSSIPEDHRKQVRWVGMTRISLP